MILTFQDHSRSNVIVSLDSPYMVCLLMFNSNICPNSAPLQDIRLKYLSDLDFDLSMSLKVECDGIIGFSVYGFLFINSNRTSLTV